MSRRRTGSCGLAQLCDRTELVTTEVDRAVFARGGRVCSARAAPFHGWEHLG